MRDFKFDLFLNFGGHLDSHGNARRNDTLKQAAESREESASAMRRHLSFLFVSTLGTHMQIIQREHSCGSFRYFSLP
jgi:hypothetical protein